jgi:hypothetical protein
MEHVGAMDLVFGRDAEGRAVATAKGTTSGANDFATFLTEEVRWPFYATLLLDQAIAAPIGPAKAATGNAYEMTCDGDLVTIEHLHSLERRPVRLARSDFVATLTAWRAHLEACV